MKTESFHMTGGPWDGEVHEYEWGRSISGRRGSLEILNCPIQPGQWTEGDGRYVRDDIWLWGPTDEAEEVLRFRWQLKREPGRLRFHERLYQDVPAVVT